MNFPLSRIYQDEHQTLGLLRVGSALLATIERPWLNNQPFHSCIPSGSYALEVLGDEKVRLSGTEPARTVINIEVANVASEVEGCIGVGTGFAFSTLMGELAYHRHAVVGSKVAIAMLTAELQRWPEVPHQIVISDGLCW